MCMDDDCPNLARRGVLQTGAALLVQVLVASGARAQHSTPAPGNVKFATTVGECGGYLALPNSSEPAPAVLLMHGEIGVPEGHRLVANELAEAGFCALVVQRFSRLPGFSWEDIKKDNEGAKHFTSESFFQEEQQEALGAIDFLQKQSGVRPGKMGAVGFCAGGIAVVRLSLITPLAAVVSFYGPPARGPKYQNADPLISLVEIGDRIRTPLQLHYGTADYVVKAPDIDRLAAEVRGAGTEVEVYAYEGATHAFYDRTNAEAWNAERGALAHDRYIAFLKRHML